MGCYGGGELSFSSLLGGGKLGLKLRLSSGLSGSLGGGELGGLGLSELGLRRGELCLGLGFGGRNFGTEFYLVGLHQERFELGEVRLSGNLRLKGRMEARKGQREGGAHGGKP